MQSSLPMPEQILEELADRTATHIERLSPVAFDNALDELLAYHRFLLELCLHRDPDGSAFSYAEIPGGKVFPPHELWIRQYRRLFARAANCMPEDDHFIRSLAYTPIQLLSPRTDAVLPVNVVAAILDFGPMMIHQLETWKTKRNSRRNGRRRGCGTSSGSCRFRCEGLLKRIANDYWGLGNTA